jgi:hypothetical protein
VRGGDVETQLFDQPGQAWRLPLRQVEHEPGKRGGVDDRVLERALEPAADEPGVERIVAVLHQHRAVRKAQKRAARVPELGRADQHRAFDVVAPPRVGVDGGAAVDESVEERERAAEREPLRAHLEHQEGGVAGRLDVQGDELSVLEQRARAHLGRVDGDLLPEHRIHGATGL